MVYKFLVLGRIRIVNIEILPPDPNYSILDLQHYFFFYNYGFNNIQYVFFCFPY